jgi:hypothetical protein
MSLAHWRYFLSLESQFVRTLDYVEFSPDNALTYSNEYAKLFLLTGSEVDVAAKLLCAEEASGKNVEGIADYRGVIGGRFSGKLHTLKVHLPFGFGERLPWASWAPEASETPTWWKDYNDVKHKRHIHFSKANQQNVVDALCGLLVLLTYLHKYDYRSMPATTFFQCGSTSPWAGFMDDNLPGVPPRSIEEMLAQQPKDGTWQEVR